MASRTFTEQREHETLVDLLKWASSPEIRRVQCPNSTEDGCRCPEHHPGLTAYSPDPDALMQSLPGEVRLRVVTLGPDVLDSDNVPCSGSLTCACERCTGDRVAAIERQRQARKSQPWQARPARRSRPDALAA